MAPTPRKRPTQWRQTWELSYALAVCEREPSESAGVVSAKCLFCEYGGRQNADPSTGVRKRARTGNVKFFRAPFRSDNMKLHCLSQHKDQFEQYSALSEDEKKVYFDQITPISNTLRAHFDGETELLFTFERDIVRVLVADMLLDPEDEGAEQEAESALRFFTVMEGSSDDDEEDDEKYYTVVIKSARLFHLISRFIARGVTFRMAEGLASDVKEVTQMSCFIGASRERITHFVRTICASNFQNIATCMRRVYSFGIALDVGAKAGTSYLDIRARFTHGSCLVNLHLMAIPLHEGKRAPVLFAAAVKMLDVLVPHWKRQLIGVSTDGEYTMTGSVTGVATQFANATTYPCVQVWCGLHQVDLVVQAEYLLLFDEEFVSNLTAMISYLRRQFNLIGRMSSTCPKFMDTRWVSMDRVTTWLVVERLVICEYFEQKSASCAPSDSWWVVTITVNAIASEITVVVRRLQGLKTLLQEQEDQIKKLCRTLAGLVSVEGPLDENEMSLLLEDAEDPVVSKGGFCCKLENVVSFIEDQGSFAKNCIAAMEDAEVESIAETIGQYLCGVISGLSKVVAVRGANAPTSEKQIGPCLPLSLSRIRASLFCDLVQQQNGRLKDAGWSQQAIEDIESEHRLFLRAWREETSFKEAVEAKARDTTEYDELWSDCSARFPRLEEFCGGLAVIFPNTATVEADFSVLGWEKDDYRKSLGDFSLEGVMQCKQYKKVSSMVV